MSLLISNDDGVYAPGLAALVQSLAQIAAVKVVAPDRNHSGASNALTLENPLRIQQLSNGFTAVSGTPTDCVHLALNELCEQPPKMVVSGINDGANMGDDVLYSGTVAAAMEGRFLGLPAVIPDCPYTYLAPILPPHTLMIMYLSLPKSLCTWHQLHCDLQLLWRTHALIGQCSSLFLPFLMF